MNMTVEQMKEALQARLSNTTVEEELVVSIRDQVWRMGFVEGDRSLIDVLIDDYERLASELSAQVRYLDEIGEIDPLLQINNRNSTIRLIKREWEGSKRYHTPASLVMFSVDNLDDLCERLEEIEVQKLYIELTKMIDTSTRLTDSFGRLDERRFMIVVPTTNNIQAAWLSDKLRESIESNEFVNGEKITCSFGIADSGASMNTEDWLEIVEVAYYKAVELGGNNVVDYETIIEK